MVFSSTKVIVFGVLLSTAIFVMGQTNVVWELNSLTTIAGNQAEANGGAKVIDTKIGKAVEFQKEPDQLIVSSNPLGDTQEWTIEAIIKPYAIGTDKSVQEPRFFHFQHLGNANKRIMMEMRVGTDDKWYFDAFIQSSKGGLALIDQKLKHPVDKWYNTTITYKEGVLTTFINGVKELSGKVVYEPIHAEAKISLGCRHNKVRYFKGAIHKLIFTKSVLTPDQFDKSYEGKVSIPRLRTQINPANATGYRLAIYLPLSSIPENAFNIKGKIIGNHRRSPSNKVLITVK